MKKKSENILIHDGFGIDNLARYYEHSIVVKVNIPEAIRQTPWLN